MFAQANSEPEAAAPVSEGGPRNPSSSLWDTASSGYGGWDCDHNGYLTEKEIEKALKSENLTSEQKAALETLRGRQSQLEEMHNDEYGDENNGVSRADLTAMRDARNQDTAIMETQYQLEHELATEPSSIGRKAAANPNKPADLGDKIGTRDYYLERYKDFRRRNPGDKAPDYYLNYGLKYFDRFSALRPMVSNPTQKWIDKTAVKLQQKMEAPNAANGANFAAMERDPEKFKDFAYGTHPSAYLEGGLANVPPQDLGTIPFVPDVGDLATVDGVSQAVETGIGYGKIQGGRVIRGGARAAGSVARKLKRLVHW